MTNPLLYLSAYFERERQRYYDELFNVSATGNWEQWLEYFLTGVYQESLDVLARIRRLRDLQERYRVELLGRRAPASESLLVDELFANPFMTARRASEILGMTPAGARRALGRLASAGIVRVVSDRPTTAARGGGDSGDSGGAGSLGPSKLERAMGFEPTTFCLGSKHSTTELRPQH